MISVMLGLLAGAASQPAMAIPVSPPIIVTPAPEVPPPPPVPPPFGPDRKRSGVHLPSLFSADDYPTEALRNKETGTVGFRLSIGKDGVPTRCAVTKSSGSECLDTTTCAILHSRGRFQPAHDAEGGTVEHFIDGAIRWELPPLEPAPTPADSPTSDPANLVRLFSTDDYPDEAIRREEQGTVGYRATAGIDGRVSRCEIVSSSGSASLDSATCSIIQRRARFTPARDSKGVSVEDKHEGRIRWQLPDPEPTRLEDQRSLFVFSIDATGSVAGCRVEGSAVSADEMWCTPMRSIAQKLLASRRDKAPMTGRELVLDQGLMVGGPDSASHIGEGRGEALIMRAAVSLTIDADGKVVDCVLVDEDTTAEETAKACAFDRKIGFMPLAAEVTNRSARQAVRYQADYTRPRQ